MKSFCNIEKLSGRTQHILVFISGLDSRFFWQLAATWNCDRNSLKSEIERLLLKLNLKIIQLRGCGLDIEFSGKYCIRGCRLFMYRAADKPPRNLFI